MLTLMALGLATGCVVLPEEPPVGPGPDPYQWYYNNIQSTQLAPGDYFYLQTPHGQITVGMTQSYNGQAWFETYGEGFVGSPQMAYVGNYPDFYNVWWVPSGGWSDRNIAVGYGVYALRYVSEGYWWYFRIMVVPYVTGYNTLAYATLDCQMFDPQY